MNFWNFIKIREYVETCGSVPPLFISTAAEEIQSILNGNLLQITHKQLIDTIARECRFPGYQEINRGIHMEFQDFVGVHQRRMWNLSSLHRSEYEKLGIGNIDEFLFGCLYHDSPEGISVVGDLPTPVKESFNDKMRSIHCDYEIQLIRIVTQNILDPQITGFSQEKMFKLLKEFDTKNTLRGNMLSYEDKFDACMVCLHEVRNGNIDFFLEKLKWYAQFFHEVALGKRLPLLQHLTANLQDDGVLKDIYNASEIHSELARVIACDIANGDKRNSSIDSMISYATWKNAVLQIPSVQVGNIMMTGEEILTKKRSTKLMS